MIAYGVFWLELFGIAAGVLMLAMCLFVLVVVIESWGQPSEWRRW